MLDFSKLHEVKVPKSSYVPGEIIRRIEELKGERIVYVTRWKKVSPTAFILNWQAKVLLDWIGYGYIRKAVKKDAIHTDEKPLLPVSP